jgi:outer membrane protein TolC
MKKNRIIWAGICLFLLFSPGGGSAPAQQVASAYSLDSLDLKILENRVQRARLRVSESSFFRRLIPRIQATASFGVRDVVFIDPLSPDPYLLPNDAFRLTFSLSVNDVLDFTRHELARLDLQLLEMEYRKTRIEQAQRRRRGAATVARLERQLELLEKEEPLKAKLINYRELLFHQGKTDYETLIRARLQLLSLERSILQLEQRIADARQDSR